jgi:hypothetical protein
MERIMSRTRNRLVVALAVAAALASSGVLGATNAAAEQQVVAGTCCSAK